MFCTRLSAPPPLPPPPHATQSSSYRLQRTTARTTSQTNSNTLPLSMFVSRLWEEGIPADGIRPFKDLTPRDWSTAPPVGKPKGYAPAHKFANWEVVLRTHLGRFVTATKPKLTANLNQVEQYLRFAGECRTEKLTGKKRKLNTQPLHNKLRTEYYNVRAVDRLHHDESARDEAFAAFLATQ